MIILTSYLTGKEVLVNEDRILLADRREDSIRSEGNVDTKVEFTKLIFRGKGFVEMTVLETPAQIKKLVSISWGEELA